MALPPPRIHGLPRIGNALRLLRDPIGFTHASARRHGDFVDLHVWPGVIYLVSHPDAIDEILVTDHKSYTKDASTRALSVILGDGLLTSEGEHWRRQRRLVQPAFHRERVAAYGAIMVDFTERQIAAWRPGETRDVHEEMMHLTRAIVAKALFDADVERDAKEAGEAFEVLVQRFVEVPPGVPLLDKLPTAGKRRFDRARRTLDELIYRIIRERRASGGDTGDLLSMLLAATDEDGSRMSDRQVRDEAMTLFLAGHETTALALTWSFYLLGRHPEVEQKMRRELAEVLGGRAPTIADVPRLRYTAQVIAEVMRLYPPAWAIGREALRDTAAGGYAIPRGTQIWISQYIVHRDPRWFPEPERFLPERWEGDLAKRLPKYAYFPFGGGPRVCIGNVFALNEATLLLTTILQRFHLELVPGQNLRPLPAVTLRPRHGLRVKIEAA